MCAEQIRNDSFIRALLTRLPAETRLTFSDDQLQELKRALDTQTGRAHMVDLRWRLGFWRWNFYFTFLFGRDHRELSRRAQRVERLALAIAMLFFVTTSVLFGLLVLYLAKSAMGVDIIPNFSFGIWDWFKKEYL